MIRPALLRLLATLLPCVTAFAACDPTASPRPRVMAYFTSWGVYARDFQVTDIDASKLTHVQYAFANIDGATGTAILGDAWADVDRPMPGDCPDPGCLRGNFRQLELLKQRWPHLKVMISVGGWTWSEHFSDAALTASSRETFARSVVDLFIHGRFGAPHGDHPGIFDGVDLDWEYPVGGGLQAGRPEDRRNFTLLLQEIRRQLDAASATTGRAYELGIAIGASPARIADLEVPEIASIVDYVGVMTYDFHGPWDSATNFNAPLRPSSDDPGPSPADSCVEGSVRNVLAAGLPADRLVVGIPFYGRSWSGVRDAGDGLYQPAAGAGPGTWEPGSVDYWDVVGRYLPVAPRFVHAEAAVPWLFDGSTFITYDDPESVRAKAALVGREGLGGVMAWELSGDLQGVPSPPDSLLSTLVDSLCPPPQVPGRIVDLRIGRRGAELLASWTPDPDALGGHRLYRTESRSESGSQRDEAPGHDPFLEVGPAPAFPVAFAGGPGALEYYQVLGVAADGATEGPN